jgi:hypothetical protein
VVEIVTPIRARPVCKWPWAFFSIQALSCSTPPTMSRDPALRHDPTQP